MGHHNTHVPTCLLLQHEKQLSSLNTEITNMLYELLSHEDDSTLLEQQSRLCQIVFVIRLKVKCLLQKCEGALSPTSSGSGIK